MTDDAEKRRKKALQHYTVQANLAQFDVENYDDIQVWPKYESGDSDFYPSGTVVGWTVLGICKCGTPLWGQGSTSDIAYAIMEGKHFGHVLNSTEEIHKGETDER
jgi:hypothetical protein